MATFARLAMTVVQAVNLFPELAALGFVLDPPSAFSSAQAHALAYTLLELHAMGAHLWEPLFALHCVLLGVLVMRSGEVPRALGVGLVIAAFGYGLNGIGHIVAPGLASTFEAIVGVTAIVGEVPFVLWLLFGRVREREVTVARSCCGPQRARGGSCDPAPCGCRSGRLPPVISVVGVDSRSGNLVP
jgi:hypothetical protein